MGKGMDAVDSDGLPILINMSNRALYNAVTRFIVNISRPVIGDSTEASIISLERKPIVKGMPISASVSIVIKIRSSIVGVLAEASVIDLR